MTISKRNITGMTSLPIPSAGIRPIFKVESNLRLDWAKVEVPDLVEQNIMLCNCNFKLWKFLLFFYSDATFFYSDATTDQLMVIGKRWYNDCAYYNYYIPPDHLGYTRCQIKISLCGVFLYCMIYFPSLRIERYCTI